MPADTHAADSPGQGLRTPLAPAERARIPLTAWAYLLLTLVVAVVAYIGSSVQALVLDFGLLRAIAVALAVGGTLTGVALHVRHPTAWTTLRPIAIAIALGVASIAITGIEGTLLTRVWLFASGPDGILSAAQALMVVRLVIGVAAAGLLWLGFHRVRFNPNRPRQAAVTAVIMAIAVVNSPSVVRAIQNGLAAGEVEMRALLLAQTACSLVIAIFTVGLTVTLAGGARAGERPRGAWVIAAGGRLIALAATIVLPVALFVARGAIDPTVSVAAYQVVGGIGSLSLLVAIVLGLPAEGGDAAH